MTAAAGSSSISKRGPQVGEPTPGPWAVHPTHAVVVPEDQLGRPLGAHENAEIDRARYAQEICALHWPDPNRSEEEVTANGRLIAAAPDLLLALREMTKRYTDLVNCGDCGHWDPEKEHQVKLARAAIAKAAENPSEAGR